MNITSFAIAIRELAATMVIAILLPCMVHSGIKILMPEPQLITGIKKIEKKDRDDEVQEKLKTWEKKKSYVVLIACIAIGLVGLVMGYFVTIPSLATGLFLGGGLTIFTGYVSCWFYLSDLFIFVSMLVAFIGLSFALYRKKG